MPPADLLAAAAPASSSSAPRVGVARTALAWALLAGVDVALAAFGFDRFHRMVRAWPVRGAAPDPAERARRLCAAVDRARTFYFKRAWCLQSAAAAVCLMRLFGVRAELVIGVRKVPFLAHAWAEVDGAIVNNRQPEMETLYRVITRC